MRLLAPAVAAVLACGLSARADSLVSLPDPGYAEQHPQQQSALRPHITRVIYPTLGLPTLVTSGGTFDVWLRGALATDNTAWKIVLATDATPADGPWIELAPQRVDVDAAAGVTRLHVAIPDGAPRDVYDLTVLGPAGLRDGQPRAVRIVGAPRSEFRFAFLSDHQLWDPSWKTGTKNERNTGVYPLRGEHDRNRAAARQGWHELELLDPDFVLYGGDLVFGLDYPAETDEAYALWRKNRFATFFVPGNHDGYARYEVRLKGGFSTALSAVYRCKDRLAGEKTWAKVASFVGCAYGDVRQYLFHKLVEDGLAYYQTMLGPPYYSFDYGGLHVVGLNTYGGTPERRHSFSIYVDMFDLHVGAPAVDNYGGYLDDKTLAWLEEDLARAHAAGKTIVVFGHHDPRGNREQPPERRYHPNHPFPTDPVSLEGFQEWNYESAAWDSDPGDARKQESATAHSGTRLLALLAKYANYVFLGHRHADEHTVYEPGDEIAAGVRAEHRIEFVRVTAAAGNPHGDAYWGYRLFDVHEGHIVDTREYDLGHGLAAVPEGNFWVDAAPPTTPGASGAPPVGVLAVTNALPHPLALTLRLKLPQAAGWRFVDTGAQSELPLRQVAPLADGSALYYVGYAAPPAGGLPPPPGAEARRVLMAQAAPGNHPPDARIALAPDAPQPGQPVVLSAKDTRDPDGTPLISYRWETPTGAQTGAEVPTTFARPGTYRVTLAVMDAYGAVGTTERTVTVAAPLVAAAEKPPLPPAVVTRRGCGCVVGGGAVRGEDVRALSILALGLALTLARRRRRASSDAHAPRGARARPSLRGRDRLLRAQRTGAAVPETGTRSDGRTAHPRSSRRANRRVSKG